MPRKARTLPFFCQCEPRSTVPKVDARERYQGISSNFYKCVYQSITTDLTCQGVNSMILYLQSICVSSTDSDSSNHLTCKTYLMCFTSMNRSRNCSRLHIPYAQHQTKRSGAKTPTSQIVQSPPGPHSPCFHQRADCLCTAKFLPYGSKVRWCKDDKKMLYLWRGVVHA